MATKDAAKLDAFTRAYLHAAAFTEDPNPGQGEYPEPDISVFTATFFSQALIDCELFQERHGELIADDIERAGRDFWYTRNGHGCGFWDGDWPEDRADILTKAAEAFGEAYDVLIDDGGDSEDDN